MKVWKILLALAIAAPVVFLSMSCVGNGAATPTPKPQISTVQKGNISIIVTGTGNLALKNKQQLSFGQTGLVSQASNAKISAVTVTEGQIVDQGQVLVKADPKDWQDQVEADQHALDSANYSLAQSKASVVKAQASLARAQNDVVQAQVAVTTAQNNVTKAQNDLESAEYALSQQQDVKDIQNQIDAAKIQLEQARLLLKTALAQGNSNDAQYWKDTIAYLTEDTNPHSTTPGRQPDGGLIGDGTTANPGVLGRKIQVLISDPAHANVTSSVADIKSKAAAVEMAKANLPVVQASVVNAQNAVVYAQNAVIDAQSSLELAQTAVVIAQNKVDDAQTTLEDDKNSSQQIVAPFKGLITKVSVTTGDIVQRSASLIEIAEPDKFEAKILVTERDVMSVKLDGNATVAFDALTGFNFPAKITKVAPLATVSQGVVNYQVTVELTSIVPTMAGFVGGATAFSGGAGAFSGGGSALGTPPAGFSSPAGFTPRAGAVPSTSAGALPSAPSGGVAPPPVNLKDGLSATVTIPILEKNNVLVVPSRAVSRKAGSATVQVVTGTTTETRTVKTGLSDTINTEITEGLNEGEQVQIQIASSSTGGFPRGPFGF